MAGSAVSHRLARRVLRSPQLTEPIRIYQQLAGNRNDVGEWVPGGFRRIDVRGVTTPISGQDRLLLSENLREEEIRRFMVADGVVSVSDTAEGDALYHDGRIYRAVMVRDWGGFRDIFATLPFSGDLSDAAAQGAFSAAFGAGFDTVLDDLAAAA